jgi:hypothetical protein
MDSHMTKKEAREFASRWLPAWTENQPEKLAAYYSEDAFYSDPGLLPYSPRLQ